LKFEPDPSTIFRSYGASAEIGQISADFERGRFAKVSFEIARGRQGRHGSAPSVTSTDIA